MELYCQLSRWFPTLARNCLHFYDKQTENAVNTRVYIYLILGRIGRRLIEDLMYAHSDYSRHPLSTKLYLIDL